MLSELSEPSIFPRGQRGLDNRGWTVHVLGWLFVIHTLPLPTYR
jgi:hypothetical protein